MVDGIFIVIDGMDGSGKSEMVKSLQSYIQSKNKKYDILTTREPTDGTYGKEIRKLLAKEKEPKFNAKYLLELFIKDRKEHVNEVIIPFLKNKSAGKDLNVIICDRYYYSTIAFQETQGLDINILINKNKEFPKPNIAFIMDINPEIALERIKQRQKEKFERLDFMKELRGKFLELSKFLDDNIKIVDASKEKSEVFEQIRSEADKIL